MFLMSPVTSFGSCCGIRPKKSKPDEDFEKLYSCKANEVIPTAKYISKSTGFTIVHAKVEGPIVKGYICIATRAQDDDGLPHTLEHLTFLGSEDYPYPGLLDRLANKCLASGTNAWVEVDHTCFCLSTAGSEGFCRLLPIYLDHVFYPLLTDAAFKTEVYHVTGNGTDSGVVYSEMQATENGSISRATNELVKTVFPKDSGYRWIVGGVLSNLRESCSNEKVRAFHAKYYHPQNACLIVCGMIEPKQLFAILRPVLKKWLRTGKYSKESDKCARPWLTEEDENVPDVGKSEEKTVHFPSSDEEGGCLATIGLLGPSIIDNDLEESLSVSLLFQYLTKSTCAPLEQEFVENSTKSLATSLDFSCNEYKRPLFYFELEGVKVGNKEKIVPRLRKSIKHQIENFDMTRMSTMIRLAIQAELSTLENEPHEWISQIAIQDFLYGSLHRSTFKKRLNKVAMLEDFLEEPITFWTTQMDEYILASEWIAVFAEPSTKLFMDLTLSEEVRIYKRNQALGPEGLRNLGEELESSMSQNSRPIPSRVLRKVKVPSLKSPECHKIQRIQNPQWITNSDFPANICLDDISTSFVYVSLIMDTSGLDDEFRAYLPLFTEVILNSPIMTNTHTKELIPYEDVVARRDQDLQVCAMNIGIEMVDASLDDDSRFCTGSYSHLLSLILQMELEKVDRGMEWICKILWSTRWDLERIKIAVHKLIEGIHLTRRLGSRMSQTILKSLIYQEKSNVYRAGFLHQLKFLMALGAEDDGKLAKSENDIRTAFDCILDVITDPKNISLHIAADMPKLRKTLGNKACENLGGLLRTTFPFELPGSSVRNGLKRMAKRPDTDFMIPQNIQRENASENQLIFGLGSEDSSYLIMVGPGPAAYRDPELPALLTTLQYFTQVEGPLFQTIRRGGYAHDYNMVTRINEGLIYFSLSNCSDLVGAYAASLEVIWDHFSKTKDPWSKELLVSAKSSLIFECLDTEKTPLSLASNSCLYYYRDVPWNYISELTSKVGKVTLKDLKRIAKKYILPLFQNPESNFATSIVCPVDEVESIKVGLANLGKVNVRVVKSFDELLEK